MEIQSNWVITNSRADHLFMFMLKITKNTTYYFYPPPDNISVKDFIRVKFEITIKLGYNESFVYSQLQTKRLLRM